MERAPSEITPPVYSLFYTTSLGKYPGRESILTDLDTYEKAEAIIKKYIDSNNQGAGNSRFIFRRGDWIDGFQYAVYLQGGVVILNGSGRSIKIIHEDLNGLKKLEEILGLSSQ